MREQAAQCGSMSNTEQWVHRDQRHINTEQCAHHDQHCSPTHGPEPRVRAILNVVHILSYPAGEIINVVHILSYPADLLFPHPAGLSSHTQQGSPPP